MCKNIIISQLESNQKSTNFTKQVICGIDIVTNLSGMPLLWFKGFVGRRSAKRGYVGVWRVLPPQSNIRPVTHFAHNLVKKLLDPAECALRDPSFAMSMEFTSELGCNLLRRRNQPTYIGVRIY